MHPRPDDSEAAVGFLNGALALALTLHPAVQLEPPGDRIYGRVRSSAGEQLEGFLLWNGRKSLRSDFLEGRKAIPWSHVHEAERLDEDFRRRRELERSISLPGVRISWDEDDWDDPLTAASAVRFGHLRSLEFLEPRRAVLRLRSGAVVHFTLGGSGGSSSGRVVVLDSERGEVELRWRELERIDFTAPPEGAERPMARRLVGTLRTRTGVELQGFVTWDRDEALTTHVLDGRTSDGSERDIPFGAIVEIERQDRNSTRVTLRSGERLTLSGSNDVDSDNRGIEISDPGMGRAVVPWGEFASITFESAPGAGRESSGLDFDGGRPLRGVVETRDGVRHAGRIRWGIDEGSTWETIEGSSDGVEYELELGSVRRFSRVGSSAARVELRDGRELFLDGGDESGGRGPGLFVRLDTGRTVLVRWRDLARVTLDEE